MSGLPAARLGDHHMCPAHTGGPIVMPGASKVLIEGKCASVLADYLACDGAPPGGADLIVMGAAKVRAQGLPLARKSDRCLHAGVVAEGATHVFVGGPTFEIPPNFDMDGPADFQNRTIRDLYYLSTLPTGGELLDRLANCGRRVKIENCDGKKIDEERRDENGNIVIGYDSITQEYTYPNHGKEQIPVTPQTRLGHELIHGLRDADGTESPKGQEDPHPDATAHDPDSDTYRQPSMEESQTTGSGSGKGNPMSENQLRKEMGLPERGAYGNPIVPDNNHENPNQRPGG